MTTTEKKGENNYNEEKFLYYIKNTERIQREKIYTGLTFVIGIAFEILVYFMHVSYPDSLFGGIPVIALIIWTLVVLHYVGFLYFGGTWMLGIKQNSLQSWNKL